MFDMSSMDKSGQDPVIAYDPARFGKRGSFSCTVLKNNTNNFPLYINMGG